jgi:replicative DNA helicase
MTHPYSPEGETSRVAPHNLEAEQGLLGLLLVDNAQIDFISDFLRTDHFYQPAHQRIFQALTTLFLRGQTANAVTLKGYFEQDEGLSSVGGAEYLFALQDETPLINDAKDYAQTVYELYLRRELIRIAGELSSGAYNQKIDTEARDVVENAEAALFALSDSSVGQKGAQGLEDISAETFRMFDMIQRGELVGFPSGLTKVDEMIGGFMPGGLTIIAGRPSMGKTALALSIAVNMARRGIGVLKNSLEMPAPQLYMRMLARETGIPIQAQMRRDMPHDYARRLVEAQAGLRNLPFWIDDSAALTVNQIRTRARRTKRQHPNLGVLMIDYLGLIRATDDRAQRVHQLGQMTKALKAVAKTLDIHVILLAQLSRSLESRDDKRPSLADLRDSGEIEEDADIVIFPYREEYYLSREEPHMRKSEKAEMFNDRHEEWQARMGKMKGRAEIIVSKNRNGGLGTAHVGFGGKHQIFYDLGRDEDPRFD